MGLWGDQVLPRLTDATLKGHEVGEIRAEACAGLRGRVLEIGFGSGLNVRFYPSAVDAVHAVEPSDVAWRLSERRRAGSPVPVERTGLDGQLLAAQDEAYDAVLSTFTLCTIPDPELAMREITRVLRPGGSLHFLEHGLAPEEGVQRWQRRLEPLQRRMAGGCHLTREPVALAEDAGLRVEGVRNAYLSGPRSSRPWGYLTWARASTI
ncbi:MAG: class I SAM-dependent methyltransferase [Nocardioidaceae bacterium]